MLEQHSESARSAGLQCRSCKDIEPDFAAAHQVLKNALEFVIRNIQQDPLASMANDCVPDDVDDLDLREGQPAE